MDCRKKITLTGYTVKYADLREPKPRTTYEDTYIMDREVICALELLGVGVTDFIKSRYERGGYHVASVERIHKRVASVDLHELWSSSERGCVE